MLVSSGGTDNPDGTQRVVALSEVSSFHQRMPETKEFYVVLEGDDLVVTLRDEGCVFGNVIREGGDGKWKIVEIFDGCD